MLTQHYLKQKALFQIVLIVSLAFAFAVLQAPPVEAQEQQVCCSETVAGDSCVYTGVSNCAPGALKSASSCEQTSFCKLGCGFDQDDGICFNNMPKFSCQTEDGCSWTEGADCDVPQCNKGCCVLSNECSYTTQVQCKQITSQFEDINMTFDEDVNSEIACINQCRSFERGACVSPDASCTFTTRDACAEDNPELGDTSTPLVGFHPDLLCSNPKLGTECAAQHSTGCLPQKEEVYWLDSCGNAENIYSDDKQESYNNGFILDKASSCDPNTANVNDPNCGNCDYSLGSICAPAIQGVNPTFGDYACQSLACDTGIVTVDDNAPASANLPLGNGESWCAYDGLVGSNENAGLGLDLAGSRHYRRICINGKEFTEPCKDYREELCAQGTIDPSVDPALQELFGTQEGFGLEGERDLIIAAACRDNRFQDCTNIREKDACENTALRDCIWLLGNTEKATKDFVDVSCVPLVSPGLKHWPDKSTGQSSKVDPQATCEAGNTQCKVYFHKDGINGKWKAVGNKECLTANYLKNANAVCKSLGDCGAWYNIAGEKTCNGFVENVNWGIETLDFPFDPDVCDSLEPFGNLKGTGLGGGTDTGFSGFWKKAWKTPIPYLLLVEAIWFGALETYSAGTFLSTALTTPVYEAWTTSWSTGSNIFIAEGSGVVASPPTTVTTTIGTSEPTVEILAEGVEATVAQPAMWLQVLNWIMWAYLIYTLLDMVLANDKTETITIECNPWQAPTGGDNCDLCQDEGKACSEYRCKSLGQSCKLVNEGSEDEKCISASVNDVVPPHVTAAKEIMVHLTDGVDNVNQITEVKGKGFEITQNIPPFTAVSLAVETNEYAQCKFDLNHGVAYEEMVQYLGDSVYSFNHTMLFSLPGVLAEEEVLKLTNGGEYQLYIKCQDGNGNANEVDYYAKFKIDPGPDYTAPIIEATSIFNNGFVPNGINKTDLTIYVNEPSICKWDDVNVAFDDMLNTFDCTSNQAPTSSFYYGLYNCDTELTGIEDNKENNYYFRCQDQKGNVNQESLEFTLQGTVGLDITSVYPDDELELKFTSPVLKVITSGGAFGNGDASCGYNFDDPSIYNSIEFLNSNASVHEQPFFNLSTGDYNIFINCADVAGNLANETASFSVIVDVIPPTLSQVYTRPGILHIVTNEPSTCEYSVEGQFSYGTGVLMTGANTEDHTASIEGDTYYIQCADTYGNIGSYTVFL